MLFFCFFKQKTVYELRISDWSSDVCSSDLDDIGADMAVAGHGVRAGHHEKGAIHHVAQVECPVCRRPQDVAHENLVAPAKGEDDDAPAEDPAGPHAQPLDE